LQVKPVQSVFDGIGDHLNTLTSKSYWDHIRLLFLDAAFP
jgi:hypothetical protein